MSDTTDLFIRDNEQDVMVEMTKLSEGWSLAGERTEVGYVLLFFAVLRRFQHLFGQTF